MAAVDGSRGNFAIHTVTTTSNCPTDIFCLGDSCFDIAAPNDPDFAQSMSMLEAGRQAGGYLDADRMEVFKGEDIVSLSKPSRRRATRNTQFIFHG